MAEIITDQSGKQHMVASNAKANAALATGIIGTSLAGLMTLGGGLVKLFGGSGNGCGNGQWGGYPYFSGVFPQISQAAAMTSEDLYNERKECEDNLQLTKEIYESKLNNQRELANAFFDAYKRDVDNSFMLYKNQRDMGDILNQKIIDSSFGLYKQERDDKDALNEKITKLQNKVDVMAAIRPYQDALINCKIDKQALIADYNLARRTCRMIEGKLVLPNDPTVTGYPTIFNGE